MRRVAVILLRISILIDHFDNIVSRNVLATTTNMLIRTLAYEYTATWRCYDTSIHCLLLWMSSGCTRTPCSRLFSLPLLFVRLVFVYSTLSVSVQRSLHDARSVVLNYPLIRRRFWRFERYLIKYSIIKDAPAARLSQRLRAIFTFSTTITRETAVISCTYILSSCFPPPPPPRAAQSLRNNVNSPNSVLSRYKKKNK